MPTTQGLLRRCEVAAARVEAIVARPMHRVHGMTTPQVSPSVTRRRLIQHRVQARLASDRRVLNAMASLPRVADFVADREPAEVYDLPFTD